MDIQDSNYRIDWVIETAKEKIDRLSSILKGVNVGERNLACFDLAKYLIYMNNMDFDITLDMLLNWNKQNNPPLDDAEVEKILRSVKKCTSMK